MLSRPDGTRLHLRQAEDGRITPERNPFGLYLYAEAVEALKHRAERWSPAFGKRRCGTAI